MRNPEVVSIGEAFIDLISSMPTEDLSSARQFIKVAGGAPANVAVGLAQLGIRSAFLGKVGRDSFGRFVKNELNRYGVGTEWIVDDPNYKTRLAFVAVTKRGDRDFEFWEKDPADQHLQLSEIDLDALCKSSILNVGSFLLLNAQTRSIAFTIAKHAKKKMKWICFDPNIRMSLWKDRAAAVRHFCSMIRHTTILRLNEQEARLLAGTKNLREASNKLLAMGPKLVVITQDKKGCLFASKDHFGLVKGFSVNAVDTTGCGDGFLAGLLAGILRCNKQINDLTLQQLMTICKTANAVGALVATKRGAIASMPSMDQVKRFLGSQQ